MTQAAARTVFKTLGILWSIALCACATLPTGYERLETFAFQDTESTPMGRKIAPMVAKHPGASGFYLLYQGMDAFVARALLADAAHRSIDVQYYIFHADKTGKLLAGRLLKAADRGVRVRLLIDDMGTGIEDDIMALLDRHPNFEIRLFNPFASRSAKGLDFFTRFDRVNRRMHNKSFTVDNQVTIVGGRNVGDEYFEANPIFNFADLDLMGIGPVVREVSTAFDAYWNSNFAVPVRVLHTEKELSYDLNEIRQYLADHVSQMRTSEYAKALAETHIVQEFVSGDLPLFWGPAKVVCDLPKKVATDSKDRSMHMGPRMRPVFEATRSELLLISPYFVPGKSGVSTLGEMHAQGVRILIITNSLAATDVPIVHAGYAPYRRDLLRKGIELYEAKPTPGKKVQKDKTGDLGGPSRASLHAKAFVFDRRLLFIGSPNLDPRSIDLNTEMGIFVDNSELAEMLAQGFERALPEKAYRLQLKEIPDEDKGMREVIEWTTKENGREVHFQLDPGVSAWRRVGIGLMSLLPIEGQL